MLNATVTAQSRLQTPAEFARIIVKSDTSGARVELSQVARIELGADSYGTIIHVNGHPGAGIGIFLEPGANALTTAKLVKAKVQAAIQGDQLRISSPSKDDLQGAIRLLKAQDFGVELQFGNYRE